MKMTRILLADDDLRFASVLKNELEGEGYIVDHVKNGVDVVLRCLANPYDLACLDLVMPRLNGIDALRIIKQINPHLPVITISGNAGRKEMEESLEYGAIKCLSKPFKISELKEEIRGCIGEGCKN
jgi:CheY-like chemotaxis protein